MRVALVPFFSQQDKQRGKFVLSRDSAVKTMAYLAGEMVKIGWDAEMFLPPADQCVDSVTSDGRLLRLCNSVPLSNLHRRCWWNEDLLASLCRYDLVFSMHETLAIPLRVHYPKLRIITECGSYVGTAWPETDDLIKLAWKQSDLVSCLSRWIATTVTGAPAVVWPFAFPERLLSFRAPCRDIDVLFNARASATGYSNHEAFLRAFKTTQLKVFVTDTTNYLGGDSSLPRAEYEDVMRRSKVVVCLVENGFGGNAFREAVACGAYPVTLDRPEYRDILGVDWPGFTTADPDDIHRTVERSLGREVPKYVYDNLREQSSESTWKRARTRMEELCRS